MFALLVTLGAASASAQTFNVGGSPLNFSGGGTGTGTSVGSFRTYTNVITINNTPIDARVTLTALSGATLSSFDSTTNPYAETNFLQPNLNISSPGGHATFKVEFFANGQPVTLRSFYANTYDLDGSGAAAGGRQYTDFVGFASYAISDNTKVAVQSISGGNRFITTVGGNLDYVIGTADFNSIRARVFYTSASSVTFSVGDTSATGLAYFAVDFSVGYAFTNVAVDATAPVVTAGQSFSYAENQTADAVVATVAATDAIGVTAFRFGATSTQTSADGYYTIDNTGAVKITAAGVAAGVANNDFEITPNAFSYAVEASDAAGNWSNAVNIALNVTNLNDGNAAPTFTNINATDANSAPSYSFNYAENSASGAALATLSASDADGNALTFSITGGNADGWYAIDPTTGVVTLTAAGAASLANDYAQAPNSQTLTVSVSDGTVATTIAVKLNETQGNSAPVFTNTNATDGSSNPSYGFTYDENRASGATLGTVSATGTGTLSYTITSGNGSGWFAIDPTTGAISLTAAGSTSLANDFETTANTQTLTVQVSDGTRTTSIEVVLNERNVDDTAPVITGPSGTAGDAASAISINENETAVTTPTANETVTWSLVGGEDAAKFAIDPTTGALTFVSAPDFETPTDGTTSGSNTYIVQVKALDAAGNFSLQTITVTVLDVVEATVPVFTSTNATDGSSNPSYSFNYDENRASGATLGTVSATGTGTLSYTITSGNGSGWFAIDPTTGAITLTAAGSTSLANDFETTANTQTLTVQVSDGTRTTSIEVVLNERNVDDTAPVITGPSGTAGDAASAISINENETAVTTPTANETVTWSLVGGEDAAKFAIDPTTGALTFVSAPDFETPTDGTTSGSNTYIVQVKALDATGNFSLQTITVTVLNVDDTAPVITGPGGVSGATTSAISVNENQTAVTTPTANESVTWSLLGGEDAAKFAIDPTTGALTFVSAPDFETPTDGTTSGSNTYIVQVKALDATGNFSLQTITVTVLNVDDTAPVITGPGGVSGATTSAITIDEGLTRATTMLANETVTWSLAGGVDQAKFGIDPSTGALSFVAAPNYESPTDADHNNSYVVQVRAMDASGNVALQTVTVTIRNVDEIARKLAEIADPLRNSLRSYAARSLSDMLSFNEQLLQGRNGDQCGINGKKPLSGGFNASNLAQSARLNYSKLTEDCARHYRVYADGAMAVSGVHGDWSVRTLASVRVEADMNPTLVLGAGVLASFDYEGMKAFAGSNISDTSLQLNLYGRQRLTDTLRFAAFAGYGKAWYNFGLTDAGFEMTGKMTGNRFTYGATLTGDINIGATVLTTDLIVSRAQEKLGTARLDASYLGEQRSDIGFFVGNVDVTRLSVPVHLPIDFQKSAYEGGNETRLELSPGLLCEDNSVDSSSLACGFRADAKLLVTRGERTHVYFDASFETVGGMQRYMGGTGFGYRFGPKNALEIGTSFNVGTTGMRQDARGLLSLKVVQ